MQTLEQQNQLSPLGPQPPPCPWQHITPGQ
jgi:hypothetical protein